MTHERRQPLAGKRVLEAGGYLAAPFAAHILSQLGAEVIKLEALQGDPTRTMVNGGPGGTFIAYGYGKQSLALDLASEAGQRVLQRLLPSVDIVVHNLSPQAARKLALDAASCHSLNSALVHCHIRGYGDGPRAEEVASNPIVEAATGAMFANRVNGRPERLGPSYQDMFAGMNAVIGILGAVMSGRERECVEIGLYETGLHVAARDLVGAAATRGSSAAGPAEFAHPGYGAYRTSDDRWIYLLLLSDQHWVRFCEMSALPEGSAPDLQTRKQRQAQGARVEAAVRDCVARHTYDDLALKLQDAGLGFTEVLPPERVLDDPQARVAGKVAPVDYLGRTYQVAGYPLSPMPAKAALPLLGGDSLRILQAIGFSAADCEAMLRDGVLKAPQEHHPTTDSETRA